MCPCQLARCLRPLRMALQASSTQAGAALNHWTYWRRQISIRWQTRLGECRIWGGCPTWDFPILVSALLVCFAHTILCRGNMRASLAACRPCRLLSCCFPDASYLCIHFCTLLMQASAQCHILARSESYLLRPCYVASGMSNLDVPAGANGLEFSVGGPVAGGTSSQRP